MRDKPARASRFPVREASGSPLEMRIEADQTRRNKKRNERTGADRIPESSSRPRPVLVRLRPANYAQAMG